ncbi:hypothetical protein [Microbacterium sp. 2FI]|uniref:hypothetical protein n=1 Tax=Microbacterium sp. 2FI TaxID=2502193 RepID=UPI00148511B2|nr:hypothetical protein [Microbacterium sp. 2FI]
MREHIEILVVALRDARHRERPRHGSRRQPRTARSTYVPVRGFAPTGRYAG